MTKNYKYVIYVRVSTEDQARHGFSLAAQVEACLARARQLGARAEEVYVSKDEGVSGSIITRPGITKCRELIKQGKVLYFICLDPDRLARNLSHQLVLTEEIERAGCKLEFINFAWQDTPEGKLFYSLRGAIAEYEKEKIKIRTSQGKYRKAQMGLLTHNPQLYGYNYNKTLDCLEINENQALVVVVMNNWVLAEGLGANAIAKRLNAMGMAAPKGQYWYRSTVSRILRNESYCGTLFIRKYDCEGTKDNKFRDPKDRVKRKIRPREEWIPVEIPAILTKVTWIKVQEILAAKRNVKSSVAKANYLLGGFLRCGECGSTMHGSSINRKGRNGLSKRYTYYVCSAKTRCTNGYLNAEEVDQRVWTTIRTWLVDPVVLMEVLNLGNELDPHAAVKQEYKLLTEKLAEIKQERLRVLSLFQKALIPEEIAEPLILDLNKSEQTVQRRVKCLHVQLKQETCFETKYTNPITSEFESGLELLTFEERQSIVRMLINTAILYKNGSMRLCGKIPALREQ